MEIPYSPRHKLTDKDILTLNPVVVKAIFPVSK
jgi:hypothetical protein